MTDQNNNNTVRTEEEQNIEANLETNAEQNKIIIPSEVLNKWTLIPQRYIDASSIEDMKEASEYFSAVKEKWHEEYKGREDALKTVLNYTRLDNVIHKLGQRWEKESERVNREVRALENGNGLTDAASEQFLLENIVFLNDGFYDLHTRTYFNKKSMCNDFYGEHSQFVDNGNGGGHTIAAIDRIKDNGVKLKASGGMGWLPVPNENYQAIIDIDGQQCVNTYEPFKVEQQEGDVSQWLELTKFICGDYADTVLDHMAFTLQYPEKKIIWQVMIYDKVKRNGKSAIFAPLINILGRNAGTVGQDMMNAGWGDAFVNRKVIVFEEIYGFDHSMFNNLKTKFANIDFELLNPKGKGVIKQANRYSMYLLSNHEDAVQMDEDEGKLLVIKGAGQFIHGKTLNKDSIEFYRSYWNWVRSEDGQKAAAHFLMDRDVSNFAYDTPPERTAALIAACRSAASTYDAKIRQLFEDCEEPFDKVGVKPEELMAVLKHTHNAKSVKGIQRVLDKMGFVSVKGQKWINGKNKQVRFWALEDDVEGLKPAALYEKCYENRVGTVEHRGTDALFEEEKPIHLYDEKVKKYDREDFLNDPLVKNFLL